MALEMRSGYKPDHRGIGRFMVSEQARRPAIRIAHKIVPVAKADTPVQDGVLINSYEVDERPPNVFVLPGGYRSVAKVVNTAPHAAAVEFGNKRSRARRMLGRAAARFGDYQSTGR